MLSRSSLLALAPEIKRRGGLDALLRYNPLVRGPVLRLKERFESGSREERRHLTDVLTARTLSDARQTDYGRGRGTRYEDWPVLGSVELRQAPGRFHTRSLLRVPACTSGTTGLPLQLWRSPTSIAAEQVFLDRMLRPYSMSWATARVASMRPHATKNIDDLSPPFGFETHGGRRLTLSSPHLSRTTLTWFLDRLSDFRPQVLWITPTVLANLVVLIRETGREFPVPAPVVMTSSAHLAAGLRAAIETDWGAVVVDYYGQAERACLATSTTAGAFWFDPAYGRVELTASDAEDVTDDLRSVPIVATGFWNGAMPLVRYHTGDHAIVAADADLQAIELGLAPFFAIAGRTNEFLVAPDGTRLGGLNCLPWEVDNLLQMQIVQEALDKVSIRLLVRKGFGENDRTRLFANIRSKIPHSLKVTLEIVDRLETNASGKILFVIRRIDPPQPLITQSALEMAG